MTEQNENPTKASESVLHTPEPVLTETQPQAALVTQPETEALPVSTEPTLVSETPTETVAETVAESAPENESPAVTDAPAAKQAQAKKSENKTKKPQGDRKKRPRKEGGHRPAQVLMRMKRRQGVYRMYLQEAEQLLYQIRLTGLGPALALLLSQTEHKSKRRIYWDISKWVFKEQRLTGKNARSLMESVVYGEALFLMNATASIVGFLEELLHLSRQEKFQPEMKGANTND